MNARGNGPKKESFSRNSSDNPESEILAEGVAATNCKEPDYEDHGFVSGDVEDKPDEEEAVGTICPQYVRCGRPSCRCSRGELHGPYYYRFWREDGRLKKKYIPRADVEQAKADLKKQKRKQQRERLQRQEMDSSLAVWRDMKGLLRKIESGAISAAQQQRQGKQLVKRIQEEKRALQQKSKKSPTKAKPRQTKASK